MNPPHRFYRSGDNYYARTAKLPPMCPECERFAEYEMLRNWWTCEGCGRRITDEAIWDADWLDPAVRRS